MRSQATKPSPKKGDLNKTILKTSTGKQTNKNKLSPKKSKSLVNKSTVKSLKKNALKDDIATKNNEDTITSENSESLEPNKAGPSKSRSVSPNKKSKKESKEKKDSIKNSSEPNLKKIVSKKTNNSNKKEKSNRTNTTKKEKNTDAKYKSNSNVTNKPASKFSKAKTIIKKSNIGNPKKKVNTQIKHGFDKKDVTDIKYDKVNDSIEECTQKPQENNSETLNANIEKNDEPKLKDDETKCCVNDISPLSPLSKPSPVNQPGTPKADVERPPKFFTSIRSPRTVDIDVKCLKNSKGNLSVSDRFLSMKFESKADDNNKDKNTSNNLISQGPEIDVYTFTEKVDSPKSILSDFRSPVNKNIGRVRPIARVKGTIIDKKTESEKKKYSPNRPIEEVVKQLKANKRSEDLNVSKADGDSLTTSGIATYSNNNETEQVDEPKQIVSKSYKMVARKSSITGKPFSPIKFLDTEPLPGKIEKTIKPSTITKKPATKSKKQSKKDSSSDDEINTSKFSLNTKTRHYSTSEDSFNESNDDRDTKDSSGSDTVRNKKTKNKKYKRIIDGAKKTSSKELKELSKDSLVDLKDENILLGEEKPSKRRLKLLSMWAGPKKHRMASLNALAKVHCLYENESRTHMELGLMKTVDRQVMPSTSKLPVSKKKEPKSKDMEKDESTSESEYENNKEKKEETSESSDENPPQRSLRGVPGIRSAGKYWDPKSSTSSSEESEMESKKKSSPDKKKQNKVTSGKSDSDKPPAKMKKTSEVPVKKKRHRNEVVMDLKDMVVQKRMASLNATAILAASYEKRSPKSNREETTSDSCSDESFSQKSKNGASSGVKSELKNEDTQLENDESSSSDRKQKLGFIVNQDTDVTITGVYSTHHREAFCTVSGMQYRISSTSHTQTTATANCEKEGCLREDGARYTPLTALSSMQPPADHSHPHQHTVPELGGLSRRPGCSSAFSAPSPAAHHEPGYYQPAGPLIKESNAEADRSLTRYHPQPHYHAPHPSMLQQYGPPYYPECYGRYYRSPGPYHMAPPQLDAQMVGVGSEPYPPPQYYGTPPCYQHSPQRIPYVEYRCPCPLNACPKNVLIGPATGKAPTSGGPVDVPSTIAPPGAAFRPKVRACVLDSAADTHGSGKDPPLELEPPTATDAPHPRLILTIGGASPKRELYDVRENLRIIGPTDVIGPPSPARGSAGACAPQPPSSAPRRARLGKAMARRSLAGDDTALLISTQQPSTVHHSDADDDVLAISPPACVPIDLSSSDERSTPLVDVKKENEGLQIFTAARKPDAQALREHNNCTAITMDMIIANDAAKTVKRRHSRPKLEIDMKDTQLEDGCKTNGIGEHVKLQKRRKVSGDQTDLVRTETITKEPKKKIQPTKRAPKLVSEKKTAKRKLEKTESGSKPKKMLLDNKPDDDMCIKTIVAIPEEQLISKPKTKSALLLDNLLRKNSIDRPDKCAVDTELNPAELFLSPSENIIQNCAKNKTLNINNNIVENPTNGKSVRSQTIAAVTQLIEKNLAYKNACKLEKVDSNVSNGLKSVLKTPTVKSDLKDVKVIKEEHKIHAKCDLSTVKRQNGVAEKDIKPLELGNKNEIIQIIVVDRPGDIHKSETELETVIQKPISSIEMETKTTKTSEGDCTDESQRILQFTESDKKDSESTRHDRTANKRCKLSNGELKGKTVDKVAKLLVSKRPAIKTDEATLVVEEACASPTPSGSLRGRARRRGAGSRRGRRPRSPPVHLDLEPRAPPRWSNGWQWDGDHYLSKVYLNNDSRLDRTARCWSRMTHASGDSVARGDCVLLRASVARAQPFVARVASLWENADDGEMMVSLVWYYRPEHTDRGRQPADAPDEVFASRHRDANSVACIEDKCYVLTFNEYCRYRKRLKAMEEGISITPSIVPPLPSNEMNLAFAPNDSKLPPSVSPELVLFCRKIYDFRSKKIHVPNK